MAYYSLHAYDADVWVRAFRGLNQADVLMNPNPDYAAEEYNVETPHGVLQPMAENTIMNGEFEDRVETIARFYRRWYDGTGSKNWLVCCAGGKFYYQQEGENTGWIPIPMPSGITAFESSVWSWVTYEQTSALTDHPIDMLVMSNAKDGMIFITPPDRPTILNDNANTTLNELGTTYATLEEWLSPRWVVTPNTDLTVKFGVIERYAERIWGGAIPGDPDKLMYSAPYDPTDWDQNEDIPEDGAGEILQPTWDGDSFTSLKAFGDQLIAFKEHRVWRVYGTNPGEFVFNQQYGGGTPYFNTIAVDVEKVFMCEQDGVSVYDGMSVTPYARDQVEEIWRTVNKKAMDQSCGALFNKRYYLAFPTGDSTVNNAMLVFDQDEGTILFYKDVYIESLLGTPEGLYATSSSLPGKVLMINYDSWTHGKASGGKVKWVSPWMDFGYKRIVKGGFDFYFLPEVQDEAVTLNISIQTEKKTKSKEYTIQPLTAEQVEADKQAKFKRLHFGGTGRKFRIIIECPEGVTAPWRIIGGLHLVVETDPD